MLDWYVQKHLRREDGEHGTVLHLKHINDKVRSRVEREIERAKSPASRKNLNRVYGTRNRISRY
jgi:hypothetical protein